MYCYIDIAGVIEYLNVLQACIVCGLAWSFRCIIINMYKVLVFIHLLLTPTHCRCCRRLVTSKQQADRQSRSTLQQWPGASLGYRPGCRCGGRPRHSSWCNGMFTIGCSQVQPPLPHPTPYIGARGEDVGNGLWHYTCVDINDAFCLVRREWCWPCSNALAPV